jgi:hypothetical protein
MLVATSVGLQQLLPGVVTGHNGFATRCMLSLHSAAVTVGAEKDVTLVISYLQRQPRYLHYL